MNLRYLFILLCATHIGWAQADEVLSASTRGALQHQISDLTSPKLGVASQGETDIWLNEMSRRLPKHIPDSKKRTDFLSTVRYEAKRAGLDPQLVLGLIEVKSGFNQRTVSPTGAQGYMQVMPFWVKAIGNPDHDLFNLRTNLRYGCTILRHYLDMESGDMYRALGRYDGSLGKLEFPNQVRAAWKNHWGVSSP